MTGTGDTVGWLLQRDTAAIIQDFSLACEVVTKGTDLLTRQSETRHPRGWTAYLRVSAGRSRCPEARKERKAAPSSCPSLEDLGKGGVSPGLRLRNREVCEGPARAQVRDMEGHLCLGDRGDPRVRVPAPPDLLTSLTLTPVITPEPTKQQNHTVTCHSPNMA